MQPFSFARKQEANFPTTIYCIEQLAGRVMYCARYFRPHTHSILMTASIGEPAHSPLATGHSVWSAGICHTVVPAWGYYHSFLIRHGTLFAPAWVEAHS